MAKFKVVYIDAGGLDTSIERSVIEEAGGELVVTACASDDEVVEVADGADGILNGMYWMDRALLMRLPTVKVIARAGVGFDNIDVDAATGRGIAVCNVVDYGYHEVANHAFALLLALNRKLLTLDRTTRAGTATTPSDLAHTGRLAGQTLGLLSFGNIAQQVARRAQGFELRVVAFDPYADPTKAANAGVELVPLEELLRQADYISVHTPLSDATRNMIGEPQLALVKPSAYMVTTSRGGVVNEAALAAALAEGRLAGAGIDVWENEPVSPDHPLLHLDNVVATPHCAWYSEVSILVLKRRHAEAVADFLSGVRPRSVVNPSVLEGLSLGPRPPES